MVFALIGIVNADFDNGSSGFYSSGPRPFQDMGVNRKAPLPASLDRQSALPLAPTLGLAMKGTTVMLSWTSITDATGYKLFYAPYPDVSYIQSIDMGDQTRISANLFEGAAFYLAVQAYNSFRL